MNYELRDTVERLDRKGKESEGSNIRNHILRPIFTESEREKETVRLAYLN